MTGLCVVSTFIVSLAPFSFRYDVMILSDLYVDSFFIPNDVMRVVTLPAE
jgi:hypothetical protein